MTPDDRPLRLLFWEATGRCNLACKHCRRQETRADELTTDEMRAVLDSVASMGRTVIVFSGGEPLMRDDWRELAAYAKSLALPTALATNGTLIDAGLAKEIAAAGFHRVSISLDGADATTHDTFRGVEGCFDAALAGIAHLRAAGQAIQINASIARHNFAYLDELYQQARQVGAEALHLFLLVPVGCGLEITESHQLTAMEYEGVLNAVVRYQKAGDMELRATCAPHYARVATWENHPPQSSRGCLAGRSVLFLSHAGEVYPCGYLPISCGNVRSESLAEIWRSSDVLHQFDTLEGLTGKCGACKYASICGGCRARAYGTTGNPMGPDPACVYQP